MDVRKVDARSSRLSKEALRRDGWWATPHHVSGPQGNASLSSLALIESHKIVETTFVFDSWVLTRKNKFLSKIIW